MRTLTHLRRFALIALLLPLFLGLTVLASSAQGSIDLAPLGLGTHDLKFVDLDANPDTLEAVAFDRTSPGIRVVIIRASICVGPVINPRPSIFSAVTIARIGRVDMFQIIAGTQLLLAPVPWPAGC